MNVYSFVIYSYVRESYETYTSYCYMYSDMLYTSFSLDNI